MPINHDEKPDQLSLFDRLSYVRPHKRIRNGYAHYVKGHYRRVAGPQPSVRFGRAPISPRMVIFVF